MSEESDLERTQSATPRRLEQAREEGQVVRSLELSTFLMLFTGAAGLSMLGQGMFDRMSGILREGLQVDPRALTDPGYMAVRLGELFTAAVLALAPLLGLLFIAALLAPPLLNGRVNVAPIKLDFSRLNPLSGIARIFSSHGAMELLKALAKAALIGGVGVWTLAHNLDGLLALAAGPAEIGIRSLGALVAGSLFTIVCGLFAIAAMDVPYQLWSYYKGLRMTREDVRQEAKETEGDPHVKGHIRRMQREAARRRMMAEVPKADVIVTNPTHYAVALRYDSERMRAPRVVAKGADVLAQRIREVGAEHRVPVLEAPPLARALYRHAELGQEIPEGLYTTVAEVLAYVFQLKRYQHSGGVPPVAPHALAVPPDMDPLGASQ